MSNKFTRKIIRSFMENCMKTELMDSARFSRSYLFKLFYRWDKTSSIKCLDDEIDFISALTEYLNDYIVCCVIEREIEFYLDPCNRAHWDEVMNEIYNESEPEAQENFIATKVHGNILMIIYANTLDNKCKIQEMDAGLILNARNMYMKLQEVRYKISSNDPDIMHLLSEIGILLANIDGSEAQS